MNIKEFWRKIVNTDDEWGWVEENKKDVERIIKYNWQQFLNHPQVVRVINRTVNDYQFQQFTLLEKVKYFKHILDQTGLTVTELLFQYPNMETRHLLKIKVPSDNDRKGIYGLIKLGAMSKESVEVVPDIEANKKLSKDEKDQIKKLIQESERDSSNKQVLTELTQDIIDEMELTLFNISILEEYNEYEYTFIDKHNKKVVYREPFQYVFRFSTNSSVIENDYFLPTNNLIPYQITNVQHYSWLRRSINQNFEKELSWL